MNEQNNQTEKGGAPTGALPLGKIPLLRFVGRGSIRKIRCGDKTIARFEEANDFTFQPNTFQQFYDCLRDSEEIVLAEDPQLRRVTKAAHLQQTDEDIARLVEEANKTRIVAEDKTYSQFYDDELFKLNDKLARGEVSALPKNIEELARKNAQAKFDEQKAKAEADSQTPEEVDLSSEEDDPEAPKQETPEQPKVHNINADDQMGIDSQGPK